MSLYEANDYLGGHALTLNEKVIKNNVLSSVKFDVGFLVYNKKNYPIFSSILKKLEVQTLKSNMSFAVSNKNKDFENYYIKYQPYGDYKITSIVGSLKNRPAPSLYGECIKALRPYATVIAERIRKENPDKHIVMEDMFFPKIDGEYNNAKILFKYKNRRSYLDGKWILSLQSHCNPFTYGKMHIELKAPSLGIELKTYQQIMKRINEQKEIDLKKEFDENAKEAKPEIDKSGL